MGDTDRSPLRALLSEDARRAREALGGPSFDRQDYEMLAQMAAGAIGRLERLGVALPAGHRLARCQRVFEDLVRVSEDPGAEVIAPRASEVYAAGLETGQLWQIVEALGRPGTRAGAEWGARIVGAIDSSQDGSVLHDRRFRLQFVAMCARAGIHVEAHAGELDGVILLDRWRVGLACKRIEAQNLIEAAVASCAGRLRRGRMAGLMVLEVSGVVWPERRVLAVDSDLTAAREIQRRTDAFLLEHAEAIGGMVDPAQCFGVLAVATIPTLNVASRHVAFSTSFRVASLVGEADPRHGRLAQFTRRFEALS